MLTYGSAGGFCVMCYNPRCFSTSCRHRFLPLFHVWLIFLLCGYPSRQEQESVEPSISRTDLQRSPEVLLVSTLNGQLVAVDKHTGAVLWSRSEDPVLKVSSVAIKSGDSGFLPDPRDGSLYMLLPDRVGYTASGEPTFHPTIKKLPFTIPELVTVSPCRSSDGVLYTGQKSDIWYVIDLATGEKRETISFSGSDAVCPQRRAGVVYIGRSEYHLAMFDASTGQRRWNATYYDYAAAVNLPNPSHRDDYDLVHFTSSGQGRMMSFDKSSGGFVWEVDFSSPIVALYIVDHMQTSHSNLRRLPITAFADRTIDGIATRLLRSTWKPYTKSEWENVFFPALYIGIDYSGHTDLFAFPTYVDIGVALNPSDGRERNVPLLEGPRNIGDSSVSDDRSSKSFRQPFSKLYEGYYEVPEVVPNQLVAQRQISQKHSATFAIREHVSGHQESIYLPHQGNVVAIGTHQTRDVGTQSDRSQPLRDSSRRMKNRDVPRIGFDEPFELQIATQLFWIKVILGTLALVLFGGLLGIALQARYSSRYSLSSTGSRGSSCLPWRNHNEKVQLVHELEIDSSSGDFLVGKIRYSPHERIGSGGNGTVVFRGLFEDRPVAVKRILPVYYSLVYREVQLLRETDEHPNVVRYFCMEEDPHFYYLALELCLATLAVYVEDSTFDKGNPPLQPLQAIHQASAGLEHLHNLNIAHRDVKPQNLLLSACGQTTELKVMISDFGLCKKLPHGDRSFSKKSGVLGTEGWIAPEVLVGGSGSRITKAIDIFSLGCVMYYVLSKGEHPFGDTFERQANIRKGKMSLLALTDNQHLTVKALIQQMLCSNPAKRPSVAQVTRHPSFWDATRTLSFFQEVSDRIEKEPYQSPVIRALEKDGRRILNSNNWMNQISCAVHADLRRFRSYKGGSVRDLLRAMRNKVS